MFARALALLVPVAALVACSAASPEDTTDGTDSTSEALSKSPVIGGPAPQPTVIGPSDHYGPVPAYPPSPAIYNPSVDPDCTMTSSDGLPGAATTNTQLHSYGCTSAFHWLDGYASGWLGGVIALCSDTTALRNHYGGLANNPMAGAADKCIPRAPAGQVWIQLEAFVGPNCQSGCAHRGGGW